jgi:hypothetical protein
VHPDPEIRTQAELVTQLAKSARRHATLVVQAAAKLEGMVAETEDLTEEIDSDRGSEDQHR